MKELNFTNLIIFPQNIHFTNDTYGVNVRICPDDAEPIKCLGNGNLWLGKLNSLIILS